MFSWVILNAKCYLRADAAQYPDVTKQIEAWYATIKKAQWQNNASWGNTPFKTKKAEYQNSSFRVQRELASNDTWRQEQIDERGNKINYRICFVKMGYLIH